MQKPIQDLEPGEEFVLHGCVHLRLQDHPLLPHVPALFHGEIVQLPSGTQVEVFGPVPDSPLGRASALLVRCVEGLEHNGDDESFARNPDGTPRRYALLAILQDEIRDFLAEVTRA